MSVTSAWAVLAVIWVKYLQESSSSGDIALPMNMQFNINMFVHGNMLFKEPSSD